MTGFLRNALLILVICSLVFNVGCVSSLSHGHSGDAGITSIADAPSGGGLQKTSDGGKIAAYALVGFLITVTFALDVLILVATHDDPFPCCRAVIHLCH